MGLTGRVVRRGMAGVLRGLRMIAALVLACSLGLHWALLQSFGWVSMLAQRSQSTSWSEAVRTTFDGQHPCLVCRVVNEARRDEKHVPRTVQISKLEMTAPTAWLVFVPEVFVAEHAFAVMGNPPMRSNAPGLRPPRVA